MDTNDPGKQAGSAAATSPKSEKKLPAFDADVLPNNPANVRAGKARGLTFYGGAWRGVSGNPVRDKFGQPL